MRHTLSPAGVASWLSGLAVVLLAGCASAPHPAASSPAHGWTKDEVSDSYIFGYPLVMMTSARTAVPVEERNVLHRAAALPAADDPGLAPKADVDTLAATAWLDLGNGPVVLSLPATRGQYLDARVLDLWTNVVWSTGAPAGARTATAKPRLIVFVPPGWDGTLPASAERVEAPGTSLWLSVRTAATNPRELAGARRLAAEAEVAPLAAFMEASQSKHRGKHVRGGKSRHEAGAPADEAQSFADSPQAQAAAVAALDANAFFTRLADALRDNPPSPPDAHALEILADLGVKPGEPVRLPAGAGEAIKAGLADAHTRLGTAPVNALSANGWTWLGDGIGHYDDDYALRAYTAYTRPGSGTKEDGVIALAAADGDGEALDGGSRYILHFSAKGLPPTRAFWTLTAYTADGALVDGRVPRRSIASRDGLRRNRDGSIDIYVQKVSPGRAHQSNWLPVPEGPFQLVMRLYAPQAAATDGSWQPPALVRK
ncbi:lipoprotein [Trinickia caryophylli]|uniref:Uncharacterized conserved protein n=2 Tax=Trinickia caryophylli TaxID=28094 RepID=A0A1X7FQA7_TRICW|nr:DUF1254 domain-containing protein [Trinickia caryophylli]TRX15398.1 DUF1254 domain-containing protein [Trinickia caryophylli]GLU33214.1 lipoprotein [Trinickia caryophylli]SMF56334.1 Uncharacterized conserved protein [Trinickia caryophylli]